MRKREPSKGKRKGEIKDNYWKSLQNDRMTSNLKCYSKINRGNELITCI